MRERESERKGRKERERERVREREREGGRSNARLCSGAVLCDAVQLVLQLL